MNYEHNKLNMKIYTVDFAGIWPVGNCLVILAKNLKEAKSIASKTIKHTNDFSVRAVDMSKSGVVVYLSGDY